MTRQDRIALLVAGYILAAILGYVLRGPAVWSYWHELDYRPFCPAKWC